jgi:transcriptional regulator with XRE-family HTH domain
MDLIESLRQYRLEHQLTQEDLAKKLGVAFTTINRWFNGKTRPSELQQYRIKQLLRESLRSKMIHGGNKMTRAHAHNTKTFRELTPVQRRASLGAMTKHLREASTIHRCLMVGRKQRNAKTSQ